MFGGEGGPSIRPEPAFHWPWRVIGPLLDRAVAETDMDDAERRVLSLANPAYGRRDDYRATTNLNAGLADPDAGRKRAAAPAFRGRSAVRDRREGAATTVDGKRCEMERGDLIPTPAWT